MSETRTLIVYLQEDRIGTIRFASEGSVFRFEPEYVRSPTRLVLGQSFEDDLDAEHRVRAGLPAWFANLLPEGQLREFLAQRVGVHPSREFFLLGHLGDDLPGAVRVGPEDDLTLLSDDAGSETEYSDSPEVGEGTYDFKFSLAGVQLKFSVLRTDRGLTLPLSGQSGEFIAKLPDLRYEGVPENEFSMMTWASAAGIAVPELSLIPLDRVQGIPKELLSRGSNAFVIRRFDRIGPERVHTEDFAQVLSRLPTPTGKYGGANYETLGNILYALGGREDLEEFVRRLVAMVLMGNGDAHLKNWSLIYADGRTARLAPAYDLVATGIYVSGVETLALNLAKTKSFEDVSLESFRRMARKLDMPSDRDLDDVVRQSLNDLQASWLKVRSDLPARPELLEWVDHRLNDLPLAKI